MTEYASAACPLLAAVGDADWPRLLTGARLSAVLRENPPDSLVDHVLDAGDPALLAELAHAWRLVLRRVDVADRLAATVEPGVVWNAILGTVFWEYRHWETVLRRTPPDDPALYAASESSDLGSWSRTVLVHSPRPAQCRFMLEHHRRELTPREQVHALAGIYRAQGAEGVWSVVTAYTPALGERFLAAIAEPGGLDALLAELDATATAIAAFRVEGAEYQTALPHARERAELDWEEVAAAQATEPFPVAVVTALVERGDCPPALLDVFAAAHPAEVAKATAIFTPPPFDADDPRAAIADTAARTSWTEVLRDGRPASLILAAGPGVAELRALGAGELGDEAVLLALEMLGDFAGTVPELLATAGAATV